MKKFEIILFLFLITFSTNNLIAQEKQNIETFTPGQIALNQGEEYLQKGGEDNLKLALQSFKKAISEDAKLTPAYLGLVNTYRSLGPNYNLISPEETNKQAIEAVNKAMELDPHSVDVILSIAEVKFYFEWDWAEAEKHYIKAISLEPGTSKTVIPYVYFLHFQDRTDEALDYYNSLGEDQFGDWNFMLLWIQNDTEGLIKGIMELIEDDPSLAYLYWQLAVIYARIGENEKSMQALQLQIPMMGEDIVDELALLGYNYGKLGREDEALGALKKLNTISETGRYVSPVIKAWIYCGIGDAEKALTLLEEGYSIRDNRSGSGMKAFDFIYTPLLTEPRFIDLMKNLDIGI